MRVIAGTLRGRRLAVPRGRSTRPTPDRVREALFASLEPLLGLRVLDLYAGTGALGIEALSRGASKVVLVEHAREALRVLAANLAALGLEASARVLPLEVERSAGVLATLGPFDLIVADPPYVEVQSGRLAPTLQRLLSRASVVGDQARLVLEHGSRDSAPALSPMCWTRTRRYGDTALSYYEVAPAPPSGGRLAAPSDAADRSALEV